MSFLDLVSILGLYAAVIPFGTWLIRFCFYEDYEVIGWRLMALSPAFLFLAVMFVALGLMVLALLAFVVMLLWLAAPSLFSEERYIW